MSRTMLPLVLVLAAIPCAAEAPAPQPGKFVTLVPELADLPAPDWVKPGVRVTFYGAAASSNESRGRLVEDPNGPWEDKKTGKRYRDTEESGEGNPTSSGEGFAQLDIISVEGKSVVAMVQLYLIVRTSGAIFPSGVGMPTVGTAANLEDYWVHPEALKKLIGLDVEGLRALRGPVTLGDRTYDGVMFESTLGGTHSISMYDLATGLLLRQSTTTAGAFDAVRLPTDTTPRQGNTQRTVTRLAGVREIGASLAGGRPPDWVATSKAMTYAGATQMTNPVDGMDLGSAPTQIDVALGRRGEAWREYRTACTMVIGGMQNSSEDAGVAGGVGLFWIDPKKLAALEPGAVIDEDPLTGIRVTVGNAGTGAQGGRTISLRSANAKFCVEGAYDLSNGALLDVVLSNAATGLTLRVALQGTTR